MSELWFWAMRWQFIGLAMWARMYKWTMFMATKMDMDKWIELSKERWVTKSIFYFLFNLAAATSISCFLVMLLRITMWAHCLTVIFWLMEGRGRGPCPVYQSSGSVFSTTGSQLAAVALLNSSDLSSHQRFERKMGILALVNMIFMLPIKITQ